METETEMWNRNVSETGNIFLKKYKNENILEIYILNIYMYIYKKIQKYIIKY